MIPTLRRLEEYLQSVYIIPLLTGHRPETLSPFTNNFIVKVTRNKFCTFVGETFVECKNLSFLQTNDQNYFLVNLKKNPLSTKMHVEFTEYQL